MARADTETASIVPIKITPDATIEIGGAPLAQHNPQLAGLLGAFAAEWGNVEGVLAFVFAILLRVDSRVSMGILDRVSSTRNKLKIIKFTVQKLEQDESIKRDFLSGIKQINDLLETRNNFIHGRWGISDAHPAHLVWMRETFSDRNSYIGYDEGDLTAEILRVAEVRGELQLTLLRRERRDKGSSPHAPSSGAP